MRNLTSLALAITLSLPINAHALGTAETNILAVIGGLFIVDRVADNAARRHQHEQYYYQPPPRLHRYQNDLDQAYQQGLRRRQQEIHQQQIRRAYECGYYGDCGPAPRLR